MTTATMHSAGLSDHEAAARLAQRGGPPQASASSRSTGSIVRANTLTLFNLVLVVFGMLTLIAGDWRDALFLAVLIGNSGIGILQELRSKRALDRLAALVAPVATVVRDGRERRVQVGEVVPGDLLTLAAGDQVVADGRVVRADGLALDESMLTGESIPVARATGDRIMAGCFVAEGAGAYVAEAVGADSYASRLTGEAREFRHALSPLQQKVNRLLLVLVGLMVPLGLAFAVVLIRRDLPANEAIAEATAGVVTLVPEGLILLTSIAYAVSSRRMARRGALAQQLSAIESLSAADVVCLDKTGTLTEDALRVVDLVPAEGVDRGSLGTLAGRYAVASGDQDPVVTAIAAAHPATPEAAGRVVPFSSRRMWGGLTLADRAVVLGAPDVVLAGEAGAHLRARAGQEAAAGRRVLALAEGAVPLGDGGPGTPPPPGLRPVGLVVIAEALRTGVREAITFLRGEDVRPVVISGDDPATVRAIAADCGIPVGPQPLDGRALPDGAYELRAAVMEAGVVGRTPPEQKRRIVETLAGAGLSVAMMGDGVNDVPALKAARVAIAPGSAADMARTVADLVLVRGGFESVPAMIGEGRTVLRNLQRVAKLFVAKSVLAAFLILTVGLSPTTYPFLPRHLTLASAITVGIPAMVLALAPSEGPWRTDRFLRDVARFGVPAGIATGLGVVAAFLIAQNVLDTGLTEARTVATTALILVGVYLVLLLEAPGTARRVRWTALLCALLLVAYAAVMFTPSLASFFQVVRPGPFALLAALIGAGLAAGGLWMTDERFAPPWPRLRRLAERLG